MPFQVVWGRSYCRAMEKLVDVLSEYPQETQYMFSPSCVPLLRCTGCCGDEALHCVPVEMTNVTMQVGRASSRPACPLVHTLLRGSRHRLPERTWRGKEGSEVTGLQLTLRPFPPSTVPRLLEPASRLRAHFSLPYQLSQAPA